MAFGVVFVMVLAVAFAINGQQDYKYDTILSEVSALKKFTFNMNVEFGRLRQQHEEMREELRAFRSRHNSIGTHSSEGGDSLPQDKKDDGKIIVLNTRTAGQAVNTSFQTHWNDSQASASQVANGNSSLQSLKGDKGTTGTTGPKGDTGTTGPTGIKGESGPKGDKGDICTTGLKGSNGTSGTPGAMGAKGDHGPKGDKGEIGTAGPKGNDGTTGTTGNIGPKGDQGPNGEQGKIGNAGPKGNPGTHGIKGQTGEIGGTGAMGQKGNYGLPGSRGPKGASGRPGLKGQKGNKGTHGAAGPLGPPGYIGHPGITGRKGDAGNPGIVGQKGDTGSQGTQGEKGETGLDRTVHDIAFSVGKNLKHHDHLPHVVFEDIYMNNGHDYHPSTGEFTCDVAGMYLFTLSANVSPGHEMLFCMKYNGHHWRYMAASGSGSHHQTASVSALYRMKHGDIMTVELTRNTDNTMATTTFEGVLLY